VNGNALIARMAAAAIARGIPLWLSSPRVELRQAGGRIGGAVVDKEGKPVELTARLGVV
jgi:3-oxosteroid 1-dehydrogenase